VFRWVGVAAPAQRCFQGLCLVWLAAQYGTGCDPGMRRLILRGMAGTRALVQRGSGRTECAVMAWPPIKNRRLARGPMASDLLIGNPWVTARPRCRRVA